MRPNERGRMSKVFRPLGYALSVTTGIVMSWHIHALDASWRWYSGGPDGNGDDPLALAVFVGVTALGITIIKAVSNNNRKEL